VNNSLAAVATSLLQEVKDHESRVKQQTPKITSRAEKWIEAGQIIVQSWSGSYAGYHSELYFYNFERPPLNLRFSPEWGGSHGIPNGWDVRSHDDVKARMWQLAGGLDLDEMEESTAALLKPLMDLKDRIVVEMSPLYRLAEFEKEKQLLEGLESFKWGGNRGKYISDNMPKHFASRDSEAMSQGIKVPAHLFYEAIAAECYSRCGSAQEFLKLSQRILRPVATLGIESHTGKDMRVFIGHGHSLLWLKLRVFLKEQLHLECDEFNEQSAAGLPTVTRLQSMLDQAHFAFLVMTSEDAHADGTGHARENVIHEAGLFQGRLGFGKAIILLEEGCAEFSNIHGLGHIPFPKGNISAAFEEIRRVLRREAIIQ
jgi:hypothetical protein